MADNTHAEDFVLPVAFVSAFIAANGGEARMRVVGQFFEREEITLDEDDRLELKSNEAYQLYLVGSSSLVHIERQDSDNTYHVVQPLQRKRGAIAKTALEGQIVRQLKKGRSLWLLTRKAASRSHHDTSSQRTVKKPDTSARKVDAVVSTPAIQPHEIVPETSSPRLPALKDVAKYEELDLQAFGQLRTMLQNVRLQFWHGDIRSEATETVSVAAQKAEHHDISGAIQAIEVIENSFTRLIGQWEHDLLDSERRMKRGSAEADGFKKLRNLKDHHLEMQSRITQAKTKFRVMLNSLREIEMARKSHDA